MRAAKLFGKGLVVFLAALAAWCVVFALTGSALLRPDPAIRPLLGRALLFSLAATLVFPALLESALSRFTPTFGRRLLAGWAAFAAPYLICLLVRPGAEDAARQMTSWCVYGVIVVLPAALLAARMSAEPGSAAS